MNQNTVASSAKTVGGKVQQGVARITDDVKTEAEGVVNQAAEAAQELYDQAKEGAQDAAKAVQQGAADVEDYIRHAIEKRPYTIAFVALGVGWVLGRMGSNRH
jgi:uncharacterized protein YjbJ (UPF0337 family)